MKVFISYYRKEASETAQSIHDYLTENGHEVFMDTETLQKGDKWWNIIKENISNCDIFIIIVTQFSLQRQYVKEEVELAINLNKKIIPCTPKKLFRNEDLLLGLNEYQGIRFSNLDELIQELGRIIESEGKKRKKESEAKRLRTNDKEKIDTKEASDREHNKKSWIYHNSKKLIVLFLLLVIGSVSFALLYPLIINQPDKPNNILSEVGHGIKSKPLWISCNLRDNNETSEHIRITNQTTQNELKSIKYYANGNLSLNGFANELNKFNTNKLVLEVFVDFNKNVSKAFIYPTIARIAKVLSEGHNPNQPITNISDTPRKFPFTLKAVYPSCMYGAPTIATSLETQGVATTVNEQLFENSNPPFQNCRNTDASKYRITFTIGKSDIKKFDDGNHNVMFEITQVIAGLNPDFRGILILDPDESNEKRIDLHLDRNNIVTECIKR